MFPGLTVIQALVEKLAAVERKLAELELKYKGTPLTEAALALKNEAEKKEKSSEADASPEDTKDDKASTSTPLFPHQLVVNRTDPETGELIEGDSKLRKSRDNDVDRDKYALIMRKIIYEAKYSPYPLLNNSEIDITSLNLWALFKQHLGHCPYHIFRDSPVTLSSPYEPIVFQYDDLYAEAMKAPEGEMEKQARQDLKTLLDTISGGSSGDEKLDKYFKMRPNYKKQQPETIQFEDLWTVFSPGMLVYGQPFQSEDQVFVIKDNCGTWPWRSQSRRNGRELAPWELDAWSYDWKDGSFSRTLFTPVFEHFDGHPPLTSLPFYPFELHPEYKDVYGGLVDRGKKFRKICEPKEGSRLFEYEDPEQGNGGLRVIFPIRRGGWTERPAEVERGGHGCACWDCQQNTGLAQRYRTSFDNREVAHAKDWNPEQYLICPPRVLGYLLQEKQWAQLKVSQLKPLPPEDNEDAWNSGLKLADDVDRDIEKKGKKDNNSTKALLLDLVRSHTSATVRKSEDEETLEVDDIKSGKGKGLVILLYGTASFPPGVGKTSTAETIAIVTRKPLFSVSVADVGTQAKHVESNLSRIFSLVTKWQAILLIDEADMFLESRRRGNAIQSTEKNALVSVFLRVLKYYQGIMFLTTNQIAQFDVAIPSRIHVAIRYESLRKYQMEAIFRGFLDKLDHKGLIESYDEITDWLQEVVYEEGFDGQQIRNIVTTALGLARAGTKYRKQGGKQSKKHMKRAFANLSAFKRDFSTQMQRYKDGREKMIK
ncbi:hypothetical protein DL766_005374 [Monosporascus sp. MC13-8B]|uniref:AAA+ ATPase domain-containing protein n=1 Tax=Monosporascus cannonballus TaxID=155416 RepID=A0ABY0GW89_9PEZI|nr:hypothetical protein DL762_010106 [Monosporascus cannonballus]RYO75947.1 hypothetical protein DL763_010861 [Monosporascus cannonballus]RYP29416.1 hypothetical protein DL766_005374 [Monosporascus sp. MC13-8B]